VAGADADDRGLENVATDVDTGAIVTAELADVDVWGCVEVVLACTCVLVELEAVTGAASEDEEDDLTSVLSVVRTALEEDGVA